MAMGIDDGGHDGLAGEIDARRPRRDRDLPLWSDRREPTVPDDEG